MTIPLHGEWKPVSASAISHVRDIIGRLVVVLTEENALLDQQGEAPLDVVIEKKGHLLLELMRAQRLIRPEHARAEIQYDVLKLRNTLALNQRKLSIHFSAAKDVTEVVLEVLRHNDSDGTYEGWSGYRHVHQ